MTLQANAPTFQLNQAAAMLLGAGLLFCGYEMGKNEVPPPAPLPARVVPCAAVQACPHHVVSVPQPQLPLRPSAFRRAAADVPPSRVAALRPAQTLRVAPVPAPLEEAAPAAVPFAAADTQPAQPWGEEPYPKARRRHRAEDPSGMGPGGYPPGPGCDAPPPPHAPQSAGAGYDAPPRLPDTGGWNGGGPPAGRPGGAPGWSGGPGGPPDGPPGGGGGMRGPMGPPPGYPGGGPPRPSSFPSFEGGSPPGY